MRDPSTSSVTSSLPFSSLVSLVSLLGACSVGVGDLPSETESAGAALACLGEGHTCAWGYAHRQCCEGLTPVGVGTADCTCEVVVEPDPEPTEPDTTGGGSLEDGFTQSTPVEIPDAVVGASGRSVGGPDAVSALWVEPDVIVYETHVTVHLSHDRPSDLIMVLTHTLRDGHSHRLQYLGIIENGVHTYSLPELNGTSGGTYELTAFDRELGVVGVIDRWTVGFTQEAICNMSGRCGSGHPQCCPGRTCVPPNGYTQFVSLCH